MMRVGDRYGEQQQCVLHFAMQMETGQASFYETAAWSLSICSKHKQGVGTGVTKRHLHAGLVSSSLSIVQI